MLDELRHDIVLGCRRLWKSRGFASVALVTLALGIGANTAVFSLVNAALLRPLPYRSPERLVLVYEGIPKADLPKIPCSPPDFLDFARDQRSYEGLAAFQNKELELDISGSPRRVVAARVSAPLFRLLGVGPQAGRTFTEEEDRPGIDVVVISHGLWQRDLGGRPDAVGMKVTIERRPYTVVGVMPRDFVFPPAGLPFNGRPAELWVPMAFAPDEREGRGMFFNNGVVGRLRPGVSLEQARAEIPVLVSRTFQEYPAAIRSAGFDLVGSVAPFRDEVVGDIRLPLLVLLAAVALVLLVACANVAGLLLSRAASREHEIAVMAAVGASRWRLRKMLLTESLLLGLASGAAGLLLAWWAMSAAPAAMPDAIGRLGNVSPDLRVLAFTLGLSMVTAVLFGLAPVTVMSRTDLQDALRLTSGRVAAGHRHILQQSLVVLTVALAVVLLVAAGLLARSFTALVNTDVGVRSERLLTASLSLPPQAYQRGEAIKEFYRLLLERLQPLPGVVAVTASSDLPLAGRERRAFTGEGSPLESGRVPRAVTATWVAGDYFRTLGIPLKRGRSFTTLDREEGQLVVTVSESFASRVWPGQDPIGKRLKWGIPESTQPWLTVVGVVGDVKDDRIDGEAMIHVYAPYAQVHPDAVADPTNILRTMTISIRTSGDPMAMVEPLRREVRRADPALPVANIQTMEQRLAAALAPRRLSLTLMAVFGAGALLMAAIGIYGILAYGVAQRTREIGVRLALGASRRDVVAMVAGQGLRLTFVGLVLGAAAAVVLTRFMAAMLYRTPPRDPWTFAAVAAVLATIAALACYLPARRAAGIEPVRALRTE